MSGRMFWVGAVCLAASSFAPSRSGARAADTQWVWAPADAKANVCCLRKELTLAHPEAGAVEITADSQYELYVNGERVGDGTGWETLEQFDITPKLTKGRNVIGIKATNLDGGPAGVVARVAVREVGGLDESFSTDATWRVSAEDTAGWEKPRFNDRSWKTAAPLGELGAAAPWGEKVRTAAGVAAGRYTAPVGFRVERVVPPAETGSLLAITFNERGEMLLSREGGPVLLVSDTNGDGIAETVEPFATQVTSCQGLLALNGVVYAVGEGPQGKGFYLLADENDDRRVDRVQLLFKFQGTTFEHGAHGCVLGPDGRIYVMVGNFVAAEVKFKATSAYRYFYEGDLGLFRYPDPGGHAKDVTAPGGTILRTTADGASVEVFCGGLRNAYDMAFNQQGELFTFDSDTELDLGLPWYRPNRILQCVPGGEYGWRSGWANWPSYFYDALPPLLECGRGSPTGVETYDHFRFPERYQGALFVGDWSQGRILAIHLKKEGAHYRAEQEIFVEGRPMPVTDLAVGPDGWLYFVTGGRGAEGGVYRVVATQPPAAPKIEPGLLQAIAQPQLQSAWARNAVAGVKDALGAQWDVQVAALAADARRTPFERTRALDLMSLFGPAHTPPLLLKLTTDASPEVRGKAAGLLGQFGDAATDVALVKLLADKDAYVRRLACEALMERGTQFDVTKLVPLLGDGDRSVRWAAGRLLERQPPEKWQPFVLKSKNPRVFVEGGLALVRTAKSAAVNMQVLLRASELLKEQMSDPDFLDLLRLTEVALYRGGFGRPQVPQLAAQLNSEYPTLDPVLNRELFRLLAYLQEPTLADRALKIIRSDAPLVERLHTALYASFVAPLWKPAERQELLEFYERTRNEPLGQSYQGYIDNVMLGLMQHLPPESRRELIDHAATMPGVALQALRGINKPDEAVTLKMIELDGPLAKLPDTEAISRFRTGIVAVLSRSESPQAMAYLRELFDREPDRRPFTAMGLAAQPDGDNWPLLVRSLAALDGDPARLVLERLATVARKVESPEDLRQAILCGLRLGEQGGKLAAAVLAQWSGEAVSAPNDPWATALAKWQQWFRAKYPEALDPSLPEAPQGTAWTMEELTEFLSSNDAPSADAKRGAAVFEKATCVKCHRHGSRGEAVGPDLSTVVKRFQTKEILESVLFPSQVISDQYAAKTIATKDGLTYTGMVVDQGDDVLVLDSQARKTAIPKSNIESTTPARQSAMPEGLFNTLTREEIADLFAFLASPAK